MRKCLLLACSNLRKEKGKSATLVVLILLTALTLNLWLMLSWDYRQNFERGHDRLNGEHVTLAVEGGGELKEFLKETLEADERTGQYVLDDAMNMVGIFEYNGGEVNTQMVFLEKETAVSRPIGKVEILEEGEEKSGVYMPILYKSSDIAVGRPVTISIGSNKVTYTVCGFFNSMMAGSHNCGMCAVLLTEDKYKELEESGYAPGAVLCSVRLKDREACEDYEAMLKNAVSGQYPKSLMVSNSYALVAKSRYISQMVCAGVMSAMAFFILMIALVVIASNILNYIQENMKSLGALKAVGYTGRQLVSALMLQFLGLAMIAAMAGGGISYCLFPFINEMMIAQTGIPYAVSFLPLPFLTMLFILGGTVALAVWRSSGRIRKIEPVTALRQGVATHNFKRNHVPLDRTRAPLPLALALKTTFSGKKHNVTICITMAAISLIVVFSGLMIENMIVDMTPFCNLIVGETADSCINVSMEKEEDFLQEVNADERVEKTYLYSSFEVRHVGGVGILATVCDDFSKVNNQDVVFEGRFPQFDNEVALAAKYARERGFHIGDEIAITAEGKEATYIISGFTQISNNLGKDCLLTREGYERLGELQNASYYLNFAPGTDIEEFHGEVKEQFGDGINAMINIDTTVEAASSVYRSLMTAIVMGILILSAIVIAFVLYLLVGTVLGSKKRDHGVLKALGYTTGQLILQTALSFMPAVILSTAAGITLSSMVINPLTALFLGSIGIVKCTFTVPVGFNVAAGVGLVLFAFGASCVLSLKIRKITPRTLITGQ